MSKPKLRVRIKKSSPSKTKIERIKERIDRKNGKKPKRGLA